MQGCDVLVSKLHSTRKPYTKTAFYDLRDIKAPPTRYLVDLRIVKGDLRLIQEVRLLSPLEYTFVFQFCNFALMRFCAFTLYN